MNTFETSETTAKLDAALAKAQGEFGSAMKDSPNPAFKSKYADISSVLGAVRPALTKHGIAVTQWPVHTDSNRMHLITRVAHDGEWMISEFSMPVEKHTAHGHGAAITYARRYALAAVLGVIDEDDDGNSATQGVTGFPPGKNNNGRRSTDDEEPGFEELTGNPEVKGYKPAEGSNTPAAQRAREAADYFIRIEKEIAGLQSETDLRGWLASNAEEMNDRLAASYVNTVKEKLTDRRHEFAREEKLATLS